MTVPRYPCPYHREIDLPLFFTLHLILYFFPPFQDPSLYCCCPSLSLPRLPNKSPLPLHSLVSALLHPYQIWRSRYSVLRGSITAVAISVELALQGPTLQSSPAIMWHRLSTLHLRQTSLFYPRSLYLCPVKQFLRCSLRTSATAHAVVFSFFFSSFSGAAGTCHGSLQRSPLAVASSAQPGPPAPCCP